MSHLLTINNRLDHWTSRSFFSAFFEPASSISIGNLTLSSNHSRKLVILLGFLRNLRKFDTNLSDISCSGPPLLCLCASLVSNFLFCIACKYFSLIWTEMHLLPLNFFLLLLWISTLYKRSIFVTHIFDIWSILLLRSFHGSMVPKKALKANFKKTNLWKGLLFTRIAL